MYFFWSGIIKDIKFDQGTKDFQPTNLEVTRININNTADNVIPATAEATFNIRFNNKHSSNSIKKRVNKILDSKLKDYKSLKIDHPQMSLIAQMLNDEDIENVSEWYSSITVEIKLPE